MLAMTLWCLLLAAAGLCYPRRPRVTGVLFIAQGLGLILTAGKPWPLALWSFAFGIGCLLKFRDRNVLAAHRAEWIAPR